MLTGSTTAKEMTKSEIKVSKMFAIRENIEKKVRPLAETTDKFVNCVNKITHDEAGFITPKVSSDFILKNNVHQLCDMVINSRMSANNKLSILRRLEGLIYYVSDAGRIAECSNYDILWNDMIRCEADCRIEERNEYEKMGLNNK